MFRVKRPFRFNGRVVMPGQIIAEPDLVQAGRLRSMGLVGMVDPERATAPPAERAVAPQPERAVKPPSETRKRTYKPRKKKVEDETPTGSAADD